MKKLTKVSLFAVAALSASIMTTSAKTMTADQLKNLATIKVGSQEISENLYIFGKYVYVNTISAAEINDAWNDLANDAEYLKTYRTLFNDGVAAVIHKDSNNNWKNLTYNTSLAKTVSIEMTHIIGDLKGEHLSNIDNLYTDGSYVKSETLPSKKTVEIFVDEKAELSIADVRAVSKIARLNNSNISTDTHKYNTSAVDIKFDKKLNITKNKPLLTYDNGTAGGPQEWIGLIIKTNKSLTSNDKIKLGDTDLTLNDATEHGGDAREYVAWVKFNDLKGNKNLTVHINGAEEASQTIEVNVVDNIKDTIKVDNIVSESEPKITNVSENLKTATALIDGKYTAFLYAEKAYNDGTSVDFAIDGDMKRAVKDSSVWYVEDLINIVSANKTPLTTSDKGNVEWNKKAVSNVEFAAEKGKLGESAYDYVVKVHTNKVPYYSDGINVDIDLSAKVKTSTSITKSSAEGASASTYTVKLTSKESVVTFENEDDAKVTQHINVKFVIVDETPDVDIKITPGLAGDDINLFKSPTPEQASTNVNYRYNMNRASFTTTKDENGNYTVVIQEKEYTNNNGLVKFSHDTKFATEKYWFGFVIELAKNPLDSANNYDITGNITVSDVLVNDAKNIGNASNNAFALWVSGDNDQLDHLKSSYTITDNETMKTVTINFVIKLIDKTPVVDKDANASKVTSVVPTEEYASSVKYDATKKEFTINTDTTSFVAKTTITDTNGVSTTKEYTYVVITNSGDDKCGFGGGHDTEKCVKKIQNLELNRVFAAEKDSDDHTAVAQYGLDSVEKVTFEGNVINVVLNRKLEGSYALLLDLGIGAYDPSSNAVYRNGSALEKGNAKSRFENTTPSNVGNLALVWVKADTENETVLDLTHKDANGLVSVPYEVVVKVTVDNKAKELKLNQAEKAVFDPNFTNASENSTYYGTGDPKIVKDNNDYITSITREGNTVTVRYNHSLTSDKFAILMDLGVNPDYLNVKYADGTVASTNFAINKEAAAKAGYTGTKFFLIVNNADEKIKNGTIELTFDQNKVANVDNRYGDSIKVTLVVKDEIERMTVSSNNISKRSADIKSVEGSFTYDDIAYAENQKNYTYDFVDETVSDADRKGTLTIKAVDKNVQPSYYILNKDGSPFAWYAVVIDLGVEIDNPTKTGGRIEPIDLTSGKFVLWINRADTSKTVTLTNTYNETQYVLTVKNV